MSSTPMSRVCIIAHEKHEKRVLKKLQELGLLHITDVSRELSGEKWGGLLRARQRESTQTADERLEKIRFLIGFLGGFREKREPLLEGLAGVKRLAMLKNADFEECAKEALRRLDPTYKYCKGLEEDIKAQESEIKRLLELKAQIAPISHIKLSLEEFGETQKTIVLLGSITKNHLKSFEGCEHLFVRRLEERKSDILVAVAYLKEFEAEALAQIERHHFSRIFIPPLKGYSGTPADILQEIDGKIGKTRQRKLELVEEVEGSRDKWEKGLMCAHDLLLSERDRDERTGFEGRTERSVVIEGWTKKEDLERLHSGVMGSCSECAIFLSREPEEGEDVPVVLENKATKPFEIVTRTYGLPNYYEIDPTSLLAPSFLVFFGLALTDAGYGIALMLISLLLMRKLGRMGGLLMVLAYGGASTIFFGALIGGWFGTAIIPPLWFDSIKEPILFMEFALAIGVVHICLGIGVKMYYLASRKRYLDALLDEGVWLVIIGGILSLLLADMYTLPRLGTVGYWVAGAGMLLVVLSQGRQYKNPFKRLLVGFVSLYNLVGFTGDILSYTRLLALGIATGIIALAVNNIAGMAYAGGWAGMLVAIPIFVIGHSFNIVINTLGAYIHASRLHYVEFFSKFFEGGGKKFEPFRRQGAYTEVVE